MAMARSFSSARLFEFDVFLSFRQIDTGKTFADHLYHALRQSGVRVFRDSKVLEERNEIGRLFDVIERSRIFVVVFSSNYARSNWCLRENEKIVWVARTGEAGRLILPVFYRIDPTDVCQQMEPFTGAVVEQEKDMGVNDETVKEWSEGSSKASKFPGYEIEKIPDTGAVVEHEKDIGVNDETVKEWSEASRKASKFPGYESGKIPDTGAVVEHEKDMGVNDETVKEWSESSRKASKLPGYESEKIPDTGAVVEHEKDMKVNNETVKEWREALRKASKFPGYESEKIPDRLEATLVDMIVQRVLKELDEVPQNVGEYLVGIKSRANDIIKKLKIDSYYGASARMVGIQGVGGLGKTTVAKVVYHKIYRWFESCCFIDGIRGEYSHGKEGLLGLQRKLVSEMSEIGVQNNISNTSEGTAILQKIYGKKRVLIVLDDVDSVEQVRAVVGKQEWFYPGSRVIITTRDERVIKALADWGERKISVPLREMDENEALELFSWYAFSENSPADGYEKMHDTLRELGMHIVLNEPGRRPETRSRLWIKEPIMSVLRLQELLLQEGKKYIEGISLTDLDQLGRENDHAVPIDVTVFASMDSLRLLVINHVELSGRCKRMPGGIKWLQWRGCPLKFLSSDFYFKKVAAMDLSYSEITGVQTKQALSSISAGLGLPRWLTGQIEVTETAFPNLKFLDLTACNELTETPNLSVFPGLEKLVLDRCDNLLKVHESIANPKRLAVLSMSSCGKLKELPDCMSSLASLKRLILANCFSLESLPDRIVQLRALEELDVSNCSRLNKLPDSVLRKLTLKKLQIIGFPNLEPVGNPASRIYRLHESNHSTKDQYAMKHPDDRNLKYLYFSGTGIQELPISISLQKNLHLLHLNNCRLLAEVPEWIADLRLLEELSLSNCPLITGMPHTIASLKYLRYLNLSHCNGIQALPDCIGDLGSLIALLLENMSLVELPESVVCLRKLEILHLGFCKKLQKLPSSIGNLENLTQLLLHGTNIKVIPSSITSLQKLELLSVTGCNRLKHLPIGLSEDLLLLLGESQVEI